MSYQPPVREHLFLLRTCWRSRSYANLPGFADAPLDLVEQILSEAARFCAEVLAPLNSVGDKQGCAWNRRQHGHHAARASRRPIGQFVEGGWPALGAEPGVRRPGPAGGGRPWPASEMSSSANMAFSMYPA